MINGIQSKPDADYCAPPRVHLSLASFVEMGINSRVCNTSFSERGKLWAVSRGSVKLETKIKPVSCSFDIILSQKKKKKRIGVSSKSHTENGDSMASQQKMFPK